MLWSFVKFSYLILKGNVWRSASMLSCVLYSKKKFTGAHCSKPVKYRVPVMISVKNYDFLVT